MKTNLETIARYKVGQLVHMVKLRTHVPPVGQDERWKSECHPSLLYDRRPWRCSASLPKLGAQDFRDVIRILSGRLEVDKFTISVLRRCRHSGQMLYERPVPGQDPEWMPESELFESVEAAVRERDRIQSLFCRWATGEL